MIVFNDLESFGQLLLASCFCLAKDERVLIGRVWYAGFRGSSSFKRYPWKGKKIKRKKTRAVL